MPEIHSGDLIAVPATGGYHASNHFGYNSFACPAINAMLHTNGRRSLMLVRPAQQLVEIVAESGENQLRELP